MPIKLLSNVLWALRCKLWHRNSNEGETTDVCFQMCRDWTVRIAAVEQQANIDYHRTRTTAASRQQYLSTCSYQYQHGQARILQQFAPSCSGSTYAFAPLCWAHPVDDRCFHMGCTCRVAPSSHANMGLSFAMSTSMKWSQNLDTLQHPRDCRADPAWAPQVMAHRCIVLFWTAEAHRFGNQNCQCDTMLPFHCKISYLVMFVLVPHSCTQSTNPRARILIRHTHD